MDTKNTSPFLRCPLRSLQEFLQKRSPQSTDEQVVPKENEPNDPAITQPPIGGYSTDTSGRG